MLQCAGAVKDNSGKARSEGNYYERGYWRAAEEVCTVLKTTQRSTALGDRNYFPRRQGPPLAVEPFFLCLHHLVSCILLLTLGWTHQFLAFGALYRCESVFASLYKQSACRMPTSNSCLYEITEQMTRQFKVAAILPGPAKSSGQVGLFLCESVLAQDLHPLEREGQEIISSACVSWKRIMWRPLVWRSLLCEQYMFEMCDVIRPAHSVNCLP